MSPDLRRAVILVLLWAVAMEGPAQARKRRPPPPKTGKLEIISTTVGASVFVDGKEAGHIPLAQPLELSPGEHTLKVTRRGYTDFMDTFRVVKGKTVTMEVDLIAFAGLLDVEANLPGAVVFLDGKALGATPLETETIVGKHSIRVALPGYQDHLETLQISAGNEYSVLALLQPLSLAPKADTGAAIDDSPPWYTRWWIWTAGGAAVALAIILPIALTQTGEERPVDFHMDLTK